MTLRTVVNAALTNRQKPLLRRQLLSDARRQDRTGSTFRFVPKFYHLIDVLTTKACAI
ncbi:MAG: hypothetical protein PUP90_04990 [Nostoc sp. S4]|nr:hypothetical protein [Nostoc sp. S4]